MTLKANQQHVTYRKQMQSLSKSNLRSFDLENENTEEDNPFDYFLQSIVIHNVAFRANRY